MRSMCLLVAVLLGALSPAARADEPSATPEAQLASIEAAPAGELVSAPAAEKPWYTMSDGRHFGLQFDAGMPGAGGATVLFRPWSWLRVNGGIAYNVIGWGYRGGVTFVPFHWVVTPTLNLDLGHFVSGDASGYAADDAGPAEKELLRHATYDFKTAQLGLEFGSQNRFAFYLRGGIAYVTGEADGSRLTAYVRETQTDDASRVTLGDASVRALIPAASLGFILYVY